MSSSDPEFSRDALRRIGWQDTLTPSLAAAGGDAVTLKLLRLTEVHRDQLRVHDGVDEHRARAAPALARQLEADGDALAVGDWLLCAGESDGALWARQRLASLNHIARRDADGHRHPVVSNVDTALFVMGLDADYNPRRLERYLLLAHAARVAPVVVLTKADLVAPSPAMREALVADETEALRARIGPQIPVLAVDGTSPEAALALAPWLLPGQTVVLLGSSGAGKSTLTNTLAGLSLQDTGAVRTHDSRGKHTTTARTLYRLPGGACVIDTPGLRALRPDLDEATLAQGFGDIDALAPRCRFRDCGHGDEPGCAVRESVAPDRLRNFHKLQRELKRDTMTALERQRQLAEWKARGRAGAQRWKQKRAGG